MERRRLERIAKEKEEFEERLKGAERAEGVEAELRARRAGMEPPVPQEVQQPESSRASNKWWK
jgi:hypothetical protein